MSEPLLRAEGLCKAYRSGSRRIEVLRGVDLSLSPGEAVAVVGDSGVGKSTLLHLLGGLDRPDEGVLRFRERDVFAGQVGDLTRYRSLHIGFVFQFHHLLPEFTALENVELPFLIRRQGPDGTAREMLVRLGLGDRLDHVPAKLSGGEQQRVAIARALAAAPEIVLADEPTGNLDPGTGEAVFRLLRELQAERGFSLVLASHSERLARHCHRVLRLQQGRLCSMSDREARDFWSGAVR